MVQYAILADPGHNRVYFEASKTLALAELKIAALRCTIHCSDFERTDIAGVTYITFRAAEQLPKQDMIKLSRLSFAYALFQVEDDQGTVKLIPIHKEEYMYFQDSLSTILKYTGKTNERFTRLMINAGWLSSAFFEEKDIHLLDPIAGKGTTLFEGLIAGFDVSGIEIGPDAVHEACTYLKKYLETERYKHEFTKERMSGENKSFTSEIYKFQLAQSKEAFKSEYGTKHVTMVAGNSIYANQYYRKNTFHLIVGDLPYGVQHGNITQQKQSSLTRNPKELLLACLPAWYDVLKPGGTMVLAWNKHVLSRKDLEDILEQNKFTMMQGEPYDEFEHRVDNSILRDIIIAIKMASE